MKEIPAKPGSPKIATIIWFLIVGAIVVLYLMAPKQGEEKKPIQPPETTRGK
jgi:hypothetical protein